MRTHLIILIVAILASQGLSAASTLSDFEGGLKEATAVLRPPGFTDTINITLPAECHVLEARMNVTTAEPDGEFPDGPVNATVMLGDTVLYSFNGTGYGGFGRQTVFSDGNATARIDFGPGGGTGNVSFLLPMGATVESATMDVTFIGPERMFEMFNRTGDPNEVAYRTPA